MPDKLLVLGGGVVGVEMAQAWASLGARPTVIEAQHQLLPREEPFAGDELQAALERLGVDVRTGVRATEVTRHGEEITVGLENGDSVTGDRLLVAIGRKPLTADLGLDTVDLPPASSRSTTSSACRATRGCTRSGTSTAARC